MAEPARKFRRRPEARPAEIVAAALEVFADQGFRAARLEDVARRAGVSKGALYLYFETKEALFRAVVTEAVTPNLERLKSLAEEAETFEAVARALYPMMVGRVLGDRRISAVAKLVIAESRTQPELAAIWHEAVAGRGVALMTGLIAAAQARGEVRAGDPRHFAFGLMGPLLLTMIWRETFEPIGATPIDAGALAKQHLDTVLRGMRP